MVRRRTNVWDAGTETFVSKDVIRVDPSCKLYGGTSMGKNLSCSTKTAVFFADPQWYDATALTVGALVKKAARQQTVNQQLSGVPKGLFTGLGRFALKPPGAIPAAGTLEFRAGCFRPSANPPLGDVLVEGFPL